MSAEMVCVCAVSPYVCVCVCVCVCAVMAEVQAALPCLAITGSGTLFGRYPQWRAARNEPVRKANEKGKRKYSMGASWFFS